MPVLIYRGLHMPISHSRGIFRDLEMSRDRADGLTWRWEFNVDVVVNPGAAAFTKPGGVASTVRAKVWGRDMAIPIAPASAPFAGGPAGPPGANAPVNPPGQPLPAPGTFPVITDAAIRAYLGRPQGQLIYAVESAAPGDWQPPTALLVTPLPGYRSDAANGPTVEVCNITQIIGQRSFLVSLRIVARVSESSLNAASGKPNGYPVLLSHRFRQTCDTDTEWRVVWTTEGEAVFNAGELRKRGQTPADYQGYLLPPLDAGFRRVEENVVATEDCRALQYRVSDQELPMILYPQNAVVAAPGVRPIAGTTEHATRVEAYEKRHMSEPSPASAILMSAPSLIGAGISADPGPNRNLRGNGIAPRLAGAGRAIAFRAMSIGFSAFPVLTMSVRIRAWGHRKTTRKGLESIAINIGLKRIGPPRTRTSSVASIEHDLAGKFVEFEMSHTFAWVPLTFQSTVDEFVGQSCPAPFDFISTMPRADDTIPWLLDPGRVLVDGVPLLGNVGPRTMPMPNGAGTRGWYNRKVTAPDPVQLNTDLPSDVPRGGYVPPTPTDSTPP